MYVPKEVATFALSEFERGLEGLSDEEAQARLPKDGGGYMNGISWTAAHIAGHWLSRPPHMARYAPGSGDPTSPPLADAVELLHQARAYTELWLDRGGEEVLGTKPGELRGENIGTGLMRAVLHTWFHAGEVNAVRQLLGHAEIVYVGDMVGEVEWRPGATGGFLPVEIARFAFDEFERGLEGLTEEQADRRLRKADGSSMNAVSWTIGHISSHWLFVNTLATGERRPSGLRRFAMNGDPTPPPLRDVRSLLAEARHRSEAWVLSADDALLSKLPVVGQDDSENIGTRLLRAALHTWFHTGEINAVRQQLGHEELPFVGPMLGKLEWRPPDRHSTGP